MGRILKMKVALVASLCLAASSGLAQDLKNINFALNWVPGPQHTEFVAAKHHGFFEKHGLNVDMHAPAASTDPIKLVASGNDQFGIAYAGDIIQARAQGVPVVAVAAIHRQIPYGLITRPEDGINEPKDLEGKTIGLTPVPNNRAMFDDFVERTGIDRSSLNVVTVQFNGPQVLAAGQVDAADAVSFYEVGVFAQLAGKQPNFMNFTEHGVPQGYFFTIITSEENMKQNPEDVKKFVAAVLEAEKWTVENPDEARAVLLKNVEEVSEDFAVQSREAIDSMVSDAETAEKGLGWNSPETWQSMVKWYEDRGLIAKDSVKSEQAFSNDFLPSQPITIAK